MQILCKLLFNILYLKATTYEPLANYCRNILAKTNNIFILKIRFYSINFIISYINFFLKMNILNFLLIRFFQQHYFLDEF